MRRIWLKLWKRRSLERDLEQELKFHRQMAEENGNPISLGNTAIIEESARDLWRFTTLENLWRDLVYAARGLRRSKSLTISALVSLALGIGANAAMFSLAVSFLFSLPSVSSPESMVAIRLGGNSHVPRDTWQALESSGVFQGVAGQNEEMFVNWNSGTETRRLFAVSTTKNFFAVIGGPMELGRGWGPGDPDQVAVLRNDFWRKNLNGDPGVVGKAIQLDGKAFTVVGVLPRDHRTLLGFGFSPDLYLPAQRPDTALALYARLKHEMNVNEARAALRVLAERMDREMPSPWKRASRIDIAPLASFARIGAENLQPIAIFFAIVLLIFGLVLLVACVNVASLLLGRASARRQEIAVRLSLGASRGRLVQQLLAESVVLAVSGAALGLILAKAITLAMEQITLPFPLPIRIQAATDWRVAGYAALLAIFATLVCGLFPAWQTARESLTASMHRERRLRLRRFLVAGQLAVSVVVLSIGFLFLHNLTRSASISPGFDVRNTLRAEIHLPPEQYKLSEPKLAYAQQVTAELKGLPGILNVAAARIVPFTDSTRMRIDMQFGDNGEKFIAHFNWNAVTPDYFEAMGIPMLAGRRFPEKAGAVPQVMVNDVFAERYLKGRNAPGTLIIWGEPPKPYEIAGVVASTKNMTIGEDPMPQIYEPLAQIRNERPRIQFVIKSATPPALQLEAVRAAIRRIEPGASVEVSTLYSSIGLAFLPSQIGAAIMGSIGILGLILAMVGLYGVMSYSVARRTREIGVRMAIGADAAGISRLVLRDAAVLLAAGISVGLAIALLATRPLAMFLVAGMSPADPLTFSAVVAALAICGMAATIGPLRRALAVDPAACLRCE